MITHGASYWDIYLKLTGYIYSYLFIYNSVHCGGCTCIYAYGTHIKISTIVVMALLIPHPNESSLC